MNYLFNEKFKASKFIILLIFLLYLLEHVAFIIFEDSLLYINLNASNPTIISIILPAFLHANEYHLFRNTCSFLIFTPFIERKIGSKDTIYLFFISAIGGILFLFVYASIFDVSTSARGSSGASMFFMGITVTNIVNVKLNSSIKAFLLAFLFLFTYEYLKIIFTVELFSYGDTILVAHLGGFILGSIVYLYIEQNKKHEFFIPNYINKL
mgnify:CR=1 FL=1